MAPLPVLLTRPRAQSDAMIPALRDMGIERIVVSPLLQITHADTLPDLAPILVFTSRNGVAAYRALGGPGGVSCWCVGPQTASAASKSGLTVLGHGVDAATLAELIPTSSPPVLHLRGAVQRGDLARRLGSRGLVASDAVIYRQDPCALTAEARALLSARPTLVPLYSPRTATLFFEGCPRGAHPNLRVIALSPAVAENVPQGLLSTAKQPDGMAMLNEINAAFAASAVEGPR